MPRQDELLRHYQRELTYLRQMGAAFARQYPKIAGRLELGDDECPDPHVERLIEAFAFLTARIQAHLESEFPEIPSALLEVLYPQFAHPIPSMAVARLDVDPAQGPLTSGHLIPRHTPLFAPAEGGLTCRFRTCYPVTLWPLELTYAGFESTDQFDFLDAATDVATVLRVRVESRGEPLGGLALRRLRLHLHGNWMVTGALYELLLNQVARLAILSDQGGPPVFLPDDAIRPVGFEADQAVLPYPPHAHPGYRLLQEYFTLPEKFLFVDIEGLDRHRSRAAFDLLFLLKRLPGERLVVGREVFQLGCTPIINLFPLTTEPIRLDERQAEYRLVPDVRRERWTEIHSLLKVSASANPLDETEVFEPFYSFSHEVAQRQRTAFWHARRVPAARPGLAGSDVLLTFLDLDFTPGLPARRTVYAHTLCTNRGLAEELPARAALQVEAAGPIARITVLGKPTPQLDPPLGGATLWRLVSQLSLNYLSLSEGREGLRALREILRLHNVAEDPRVDQQIQGVTGMACRPVVRRVGFEAWRGFCRGIEVDLEFDEQAYVGSHPFLFGLVLNHFLALHAAVNTFTQLVIRSRQRPGIWKAWPPTVGRQIVL
jgi:type VI secretion system protein ImpG